MWEKMNGLEKFFRVYGILEIIGGIILALIFGPGDPGSGYTWKAVAFTTSIICISVGLIFGVIFIAVGNAMYYLRNTMEKTNDIYSSLQRSIDNAKKIDTSEKKLEIKSPLVLEETGLTKEQQANADILRRSYGEVAYEQYVKKTINENIESKGERKINRSTKYAEISDEEIKAKYETAINPQEKNEIKIELVARGFEAYKYMV